MKRKISGRLKDVRPFDFVARDGNFIRNSKGGLSLLGKAYGFFYSYASKEQIEALLPTARRVAKTPESLELTLIEGTNPDNIRDSKLMELAGLAKDQGNNYTMIGNLPNATNESTAKELGILQNTLYQSPLQRKFHKGDGKFYGGIVYKKGKRYEFLE